MDQSCMETDMILPPSVNINSLTPEEQKKMIDSRSTNMWYITHPTLEVQRHYISDPRVYNVKYINNPDSSIVAEMSKRQNK